MNNLELFQLNPFRKEVSPGISLFTAVKNRKNLLQQVLPTWVACKEIDEIIIVDWSSDKSILPLIRKYQNGKVFTVVVKEQERWILSHAFNLAARLTTRDKILKIDADVKILPGFFEKHILTPGRFYSGYWGMGRDENERHLNGNAFLYRNDFFRINGYNEYIKSYGWDDDDLFLRLGALRLKRIYFHLDTLVHLEHEDRTTFQESPGYLNAVNDQEKANIQIIINRYLTQNFKKWLPENQMLGFEFKILDDHTLSCLQATEDQNLLPDELIRICEIPAIQERLKQSGILISDDIARNLKREEVIEFFNLFVSADASPANQYLFSFIKKLNEIHQEIAGQKENEISRIKELVLHKEKIISGKEQDIRTKNEENFISRRKILEQTISIEEQAEQIRAKERIIGEKENQIRKKNEHIQQKELTLREKDAQLRMKDQLVADKEHRIMAQDKTIQEKDKTIQDKDEVIRQNKQVILEKEQAIQHQDRTNHEQAEAISTAKETIREKEQVIAEKIRLINEKENQVRKQDEIIRQKDLIIGEKELKIRQKEKDIKEKERTLEEKNRIVISLELHLHTVQNLLNDLYKSYSWRFGHLIFSGIGKLMLWPKHLKRFILSLKGHPEGNEGR